MYRQISQYLCLLFFVLNCHTSVAQPRNQWEHYYDGMRDDRGYLRDVYKTEDGFALTGSTGNINGELDPHSLFWLIITDENGNRTSQHAYRPQEWRFGESFSVIQCDDGGFLMGGTQRTNDISRFTVIRTDDEGDMLWNMVMGDRTYCWAVIELKDGNYIGCGRIYENGTHCYAVKFNDDGEVIWEESYDGNRFWVIKEVDNGYIFAGHGWGGGIDNKD